MPVDGGPRNISCLYRRCAPRSWAARSTDLGGTGRLTATLDGSPRARARLCAHCHLGLGKLYGRTGKREQAQEHLTTAITMYRDMGMTYWLEKAEAERGELQ